jgi:hypothetical protein
MQLQKLQYWGHECLNPRPIEPSSCRSNLPTEFCYQIRSVFNYLEFDLLFQVKNGLVRSIRVFFPLRFVATSCFEWLESDGGLFLVLRFDIEVSPFQDKIRVAPYSKGLDVDPRWLSTYCTKTSDICLVIQII